MLFLFLSAPSGPANDMLDMYSQEAARFCRLLSSSSPERRIQGIQGLSHLKFRAAEDKVLERLTDDSPAVQREALLALGRIGSVGSVPHFISLLSHASWEFRENAWVFLQQFTAQGFAADQKSRWEQWWSSTPANERERLLLEMAEKQGAARHDALRALSHTVSAFGESRLIELLRQPGLSAEERNWVAEALEHAGGPRAIPALAGYVSEASAYALGQIGGPAAEKALLQFPKTLGVLINLDRLGSTNAAPFIPFLVGQMGLVTYRGQPDDLMNAEAQPIQVVGANLIRRSGQAPLLIELVLQELEDSMKPPIPHRPRPAAPVSWDSMLNRMREELKPGFVRDDGLTRSQPLTALLHVAEDATLSKRLLPLLNHPAYVPRVYVAMLLGKLKATNALPEMLALVRAGYPFSDAVALASGKHFDQSQTVRWRGFLCMAIGRLGDEEARRALEHLALDHDQPRDIRYSAVIGLGFIGASDSLPILREVAKKDIIWMVREEARRVADDIEISSQDKRTPGFHNRAGGPI